MHLALRGFRRRRRNDFRPERIGAKLAACRQAEHPVSARRDLAVLARAAPRAWPAGLPHGVAHGDLFTDNARWSRGRLVGVLDFEMAGDAPLAYDVAVAMCAWAFVGARLHPARARAVLRGYHRRRPLAHAELRALFGLCRFAATRFAVTRFHDFELHRQPEVDRVRKDYREYVSRLRRLRELGAAGFRRRIVEPATGHS